MKTHTSGFKNQIKQIGREINNKITYTIGNETIVLESELLNAITPHYEGDILKSVMKQLDIDSNVLIPEGTEINYQFGLKVNGSYEYINFGNYIVYSIEKKEDTRSWKLVCYDKMLYSMKEYQRLGSYALTEDQEFVESKKYYIKQGDKYSLYQDERIGDPSALGLYEFTPITYPITIREYLQSICDFLNIDFANAEDQFVNYNKEIESELYLSYNETTDEYESLDYTFRDVLDEIAGATASTICINKDNELEVRYITDTNDTIDEEYLKDINVNFGDKYGPINSVVFSRSAQSDNIYRQDISSVDQNGLHEIKIVDNQILNSNNRDDFIDEIYNELLGFEYYANDYSSTGIGYYDLCDRYNITIDQNTYSCVMFNDEFLVTQGLQENIHTDIPEKTETDYSKADITDKRIKQAYIIVNKATQTIESFTGTVEGLQGLVDSQGKQITELGARVTQTDDEWKASISGVQSQLDNGVGLVKTTSVTINDEGLTVATDTSQIATTMTNEEFKIMQGDERLAWFGYDNETSETKMELRNLTVEKYFIVGNHRVEAYDNNGEHHTGFFYIGGS